MCLLTLKEQILLHKKRVSFDKIKKACKDLKIDIYKNFFFLFDECEKIVQDIDYRQSISNPINDFFDHFQTDAIFQCLSINTISHCHCRCFFVIKLWKKIFCHLPKLFTFGAILDVFI